MKVLSDAFSRRLSYLRLSVTEVCNFRCSYCLPQGYRGGKRRDELSLSEIETLVSTFARNGTRKIRLSGGEPTLRRDLPEIIALCKAQDNIRSVALTSNAYRLAERFPLYVQAGLDRINLSLDSFQARRFASITGKDECQNILTTIDAILASGFGSLKINTLLLKSSAAENIRDALVFLRDRPLTLRFIELMQTSDNGAFFKREHLSAAPFEQNLQLQGWQLQTPSPDAGPAREYRHADFQGGIGFITPYSRDFCTACNRLRVTAQGKMHLCLFGGFAYDLRPYLRCADGLALQEALQRWVIEKPARHLLHEQNVGLIRDLSMIGG